MISKNKAFYDTLDYFIKISGTSRTQVSLRTGRCKTGLNPSKKNDKWISLGFFFDILETLKVDAKDFFEMMEILQKKSKK